MPIKLLARPYLFSKPALEQIMPTRSIALLIIRPFARSLYIFVFVAFALRISSSRLKLNHTRQHANTSAFTLIHTPR
jgi:hypothetical protein